MSIGRTAFPLSGNKLIFFNSLYQEMFAFGETQEETDPSRQQWKWKQNISLTIALFSLSYLESTNARAEEIIYVLIPDI